MIMTKNLEEGMLTSEYSWREMTVSATKVINDLRVEEWILNQGKIEVENWNP